MEINLFPAFCLIKAVLPGMTEGVPGALSLWAGRRI